MAYKPKDRDRICLDVVSRLETGEPLTHICKTDGYPDPATIWRWTEADQALMQDIARARLIGFDAIAEDCLNIADDNGADKRMTANGEVVDGDHIQRSKLRIETRLKLLAKWDPKRYGDRMHNEHTGKDGKDLPPSVVMYQIPSNGRDSDDN
jgi:hypothetical protein